MNKIEIAQSVGMAGYGWLDLIIPKHPDDPESWEHEFEYFRRTNFDNVITEAGDKIYGERCYDSESHAAPQGMQLGTNAAAATKSGPGAAIGTYVAGSSMSLTVGYPTSTLVSGKRQIQYKAGWGPGVAQHAALAEIALVNQSMATNAAAPAANTLSRARINPTVDKSDALIVLVATWNHLIYGAP